MSLNILKGESPKEYLDDNIMTYIERQKVEKIVYQIQMGAFPEFMILELALANGATSRSEALLIEREVRRKLSEKKG